jgi:hypothetical protein
MAVEPDVGNMLRIELLVEVLEEPVDPEEVSEEP